MSGFVNKLESMAKDLWHKVADKEKSGKGKGRHGRHGQAAAAASGAAEPPPRPRPIGCVFGRSLDEALAREGPGTKVPWVMERCAAHIEQYGLQSEGIFRVPGNAESMSRLKANIDALSLTEIPETADVNDVAGLLKMYIRELPEPLLTFDAYSEFVGAAREGSDGLGERVKGLVGALREEHQAALGCLVELLHKVSKQSELNRMTAGNLAIVFAPNVLHARDETMEQVMSDQAAVEAIITHMIENFGSEADRGDEGLDDDEMEKQDDGKRAEAGGLVGSDDAPEREGAAGGEMRPERGESEGSLGHEEVEKEEKRGGEEDEEVGEGDAAGEDASLDALEMKETGYA